MRELQLFAGFPHPTGGGVPSMSTMDTTCWHAKLFVVGFSNVTDGKNADRKHVTLQDLVSSLTFQNRVRPANVSTTNESGQNRAKIRYSI